MANLLLVYADGRRRAQLEVAAARAGHRTYGAGNAQEAARMAEVYIPDAAVLGEELPAAEASAFVAALRRSGRSLLRELPVIALQAMPADAYVIRPASGSADSILAALDGALSQQSA